MSLFNTRISGLFRSFWLMTAFVLFIMMVLPAKFLYGQFAGGNGTIHDPYLIENVDHLQAIRNAPDTAHYKLINNIDASATNTWNNGQGFNPIGWFGGKIDGDGFTVSNLFINRPGINQVALITHMGSSGVVEKINFSNTSITGGDWTAVVAGTLAGNISNVIITGSVTGQNQVGGIAGYNNQGTFINSSSEGSVSGVEFVGGLVGINDGSVLQCNSSSDVTATNDEAGGLIGRNHNGTVYDSYTSGTVAGNNNVGGLIGWSGDGSSIINNCNSSSSVTGHQNVGGLIGQIFSGTVEESYSSGEVNGRTNVGGLAGYSQSGTLIRISFSTADVYPISGGGNRNQFGGLVGYANQTTIENCFAKGSVEGNNRVGGLIGEIDGGSVTNSYSSGFVNPGAGQSGGFIGRSSGNASINNSFWDVETSGFTNSAGGTPKTTSQMLDVSTYQQANWNFSYIWEIDAELNNGYPFLIPLAGAFMILWTGEINTDWLNSENWNIKAIPGHNDNVRIPNVDNKPLITTNVFIRGLNIQLNSSITISNNGTLEVSGTINNMGGVSGIIVLSNEDGTGSLIHNNSNVPATFQRYISREPEAWHLLSSPVSNQEISGDFTPIGGINPYGDSTRYDFYLWHEPDTSWIYLLNTEYPPTWAQAHPSSDFMTGRGYLVSYLDPNPTLAFSGLLHNGEVQIPVSHSGTTAAQFGANLVGNPFPSSVDWKADAGWNRSDLELSEGGYDIWIWNDTAFNYGVYNSSSISDEGTLGVTRFIPPTQGFFVSASQSGNLILNNAARVHEGAGNWLKGISRFTQLLHIVAASSKGTGSDEVLIEFNKPHAEGGTVKKFSFVPQAPSLFIPRNGQFYSMQFLESPAKRPVMPLSFKAGKDGIYAFTFNFDPDFFEILELHDLKTGIKQNLKDIPGYEFMAAANDKAGRFVLQFIPGHYANPHDALPVQIYAYNKVLYLDLQLLQGNYIFEAFDAGGRNIMRETLYGGVIYERRFQNSGLFITRISGAEGTLVRKIILF